VLTSLEIKNFRTFSHLNIERLGRVNLIVGKNNVGKTTLLEALRFYAMGSPTALRECLVNRDEVQRQGLVGEAQLDLQALFHGRPRGKAEASIGSPDQLDQRLTIRLTKLERIEHSDGRYHYDEYEDVGTGTAEGEVFSGVTLEQEGKLALISPEPTLRAAGQGRYAGPPFVTPAGVRDADLAQWWEEISLTDADNRVIKWLSLMTPVERIATLDNPIHGGRMFKARIAGNIEPLPLKSLGDGTYRIFQIATAIEFAFRQPRIDALVKRDDPSKNINHPVLIDEIENGVHYSVLSDLWRSLLRAARERDLQFFITTHSLDCLRGFAEAVAEDEQNDGMAIRLERDPGEEATRAVIIDREALPIVARDRIEVR